MPVSRRRYVLDLAAARSATDRVRRERDDAREEREAFRAAAATAARQFAEADATNIRLRDRVERLTVLLAEARRPQPYDETIGQLRERLDRALRGVARWRAEATDGRRVSRVLSEQLISAIGTDYTDVQRARLGLPAGEQKDVVPS